MWEHGILLRGASSLKSKKGIHNQDFGEIWNRGRFWISDSTTGELFHILMPPPRFKTLRMPQLGFQTWRNWVWIKFHCVLGFNHANIYWLLDIVQPWSDPPFLMKTGSSLYPTKAMRCRLKRAAAGSLRSWKNGAWELARVMSPNLLGKLWFGCQRIPKVTIFRP